MISGRDTEKNVGTCGQQNLTQVGIRFAQLETESRSSTKLSMEWGRGKYTHTYTPHSIYTYQRNITLKTLLWVTVVFILLLLKNNFLTDHN